MSKYLEIADEVLREIGYQPQQRGCDISDLCDQSHFKPNFTDDDCDQSPAVFEYRLHDDPDAWLVMISPPGTDLDRARGRIVHQFGADRVIEVKERRL